jgi:hypothetical protein
MVPSAVVKKQILAIAANIRMGLDDPLGRGLPALKEVARELEHIGRNIPDEPDVDAVVVWGETPDIIATRIAEQYGHGFYVVALSGSGSEYIAVMERRS